MNLSVKWERMVIVLSQPLLTWSPGNPVVAPESFGLLFKDFRTHPECDKNNQGRFLFYASE
jgi:hypothetical protein